MVMVSKKSKKSQDSLLYQKIIITIILVSMIVILIAVLISFLFKPENLVKSKISNLSSNYYENYLYDGLNDSANFSGDYKSTLEKYKDTGLTYITLRQLILHNKEENASTGEYIKEYCDEEKTTIKFFPEEPYGKTNYHIEYHYVCNF